MGIAEIIAIAAISYLIGAIPTAYFVARVRGVNIFEVGSGNMGATNTARAVGNRAAMVVFALDALKGVGAIFLARLLFASSDNILFVQSGTRAAAATVIAALFVIAGHNWSIFVHRITGELKGGKGAATALGTFVTIAPWFVIAGIVAVGLVLITRTRYISLGALGMSAIALIWMLVLFAQGFIPREYIVYIICAATMIFWRFRENIGRLLSGTERRFGERA
jgi:acyl phosphate:glycerol-3-phosphate acyltransferase